MSNRIRKFEDGNTKRKKKLKTEALIGSQRSSLLKYVTSNKDNVNQFIHHDNETTNETTNDVETPNYNEIPNETTTDVETPNNDQPTYNETTNDVETQNNDEPKHNETTTNVEAPKNPNNDETINKPTNLYIFIISSAFCTYSSIRSSVM